MRRSQLLRWMAASLLPILILAAANAEPVPAQTVSVREFRQRVDNYFSLYGNKAPVEVLHDATATAEMTELSIEIGALLDQGESLQGFADVGLVAAQSGRSVSIDFKEFPQWILLQERLRELRDPDGFAFYASTLRERGFRDEDFATLASYLSTHGLDQTIYQAGKSRLERHVNQIRSGKDISVAEYCAFINDVTRRNSEITRRWSMALLDGLDHQSQQVLVATLNNMEGGMTFGADGDMRENLRQHIAMVRSDATVEQMRQQAEQFARPRTRTYSLHAEPPPEEARDVQWSEPMEQRLEQYFSSHRLADRFQMVRIDCRTTYCDLKAEGEQSVDTQQAFATAVEELCRRDWGLVRSSGDSSGMSNCVEMHERLNRKL